MHSAEEILPPQSTPASSSEVLAAATVASDAVKTEETKKHTEKVASTLKDLTKGYGEWGRRATDFNSVVQKSAQHRNTKGSVMETDLASLIKQGKDLYTRLDQLLLAYKVQSKDFTGEQMTEVSPPSTCYNKGSEGLSNRFIREDIVFDIVPFVLKGLRV